MFSRLRRLIRVFRPTETLSSLAAYQQWAATYPPAAHNVLMQVEEAAMRSLMPPVAGMAILDLGCGSGRYTQIALGEGARVVIGIDNSPAMLKVNAGLLRVLANLDAVPLPANSVEGVLCGLAIGHIPRIDRFAAETARVLRPGGWALVSDFHPFVFLNGARRTFTGTDGRTYAVEHYVHLYSDLLAASTAAGLTIDTVLEPRLDAGTVPGLGHAPVVIVYRLRKPL